MSEEKNETEDGFLGVTSSGIVITEELAEHWATEFENEDLDLTRLERRYVFPLPPIDHGPKVGTAFPLSRSEVDSIKHRAEKEGRPVRDLLREALES